MIGQLLGPVAGLASSWLDAKTTKQAAEAKLKLTEAEAKAKILLSKRQALLIGNASWQRIVARPGKTNFSLLCCQSINFGALPGAEGHCRQGL